MDNAIRKFFIRFLIVIGLIVIWFWPNIHGQYRFKQYCAREGGLKVYGKVLPDQGWLAAGTDPQEYKLPFSFKRVAFVRYQDKTGARFDVYIKPNPWPKDPDYVFQPVDESKPVMYMLKYQDGFLPGELRLARSQYAIFSILKNKVIVSHTRFGYRQFDQDKTLLGAPSGVQCPNESREDHFFNLFSN